MICKGTSTEAGLTIDQIFGGMGIGYIWNGNNYGWSPSSDSGLPTLPDSQWAFVALVIDPTSAALYICDASNFANFASVTNTFNVSHPAQAFDGPTLVGAEGGFEQSVFQQQQRPRGAAAEDRQDEHRAAVGVGEVRVNVPSALTPLSVAARTV